MSGIRLMPGYLTRHVIPIHRQPNTINKVLFESAPYTINAIEARNKARYGTSVVTVRLQMRNDGVTMNKSVGYNACPTNRLAKK